MTWPYDNLALTKGAVGARLAQGVSGATVQYSTVHGFSLVDVTKTCKHTLRIYIYTTLSGILSTILFIHLCPNVPCISGRIVYIHIQ